MPPELKYLNLAQHLRSLLDKWETQDSELQDALANLDDQYRDPESERRDIEKIRVRRDREVMREIERVTNPEITITA